MTNLPKTVELKMAYHWICERCSADNFALPSREELTDEDREEAYRIYHALDEWSELPEGWKDFDFVWKPRTVTCQNCGETFETKDEERC